MSKIPENSRPTIVEKKGTDEPRADLYSIYLDAKRIYREEEAMLALCKNCMESIRVKKAVVDKMREETEAEMIASAGRLDEQIRKVTRILDALARRHLTDSNEAAERLGKLLDLDVDSDMIMEDLRKRLALLEYQRKGREPLLHRIYLLICSALRWLAMKVKRFLEACRAALEWVSRKGAAIRQYQETANVMTAPIGGNTSEFTSTPVRKLTNPDEVNVSIRQRLSKETYIE